MIGTSKTLLKETMVEEAVTASPYFEKFGFIFNDMPTVTKLKPVLEKLIPSGKTDLKNSPNSNIPAVEIMISGLS